MEDIPSSKLAQWSEGCSCHEPLVLRVSDYRRHDMMRRHYGEGFVRCPASGMRADCMAAGRHLEVLAEVTDLASAVVLFGEGASLHPLAEDELRVLQTDLETAKRVLECELRTKCDFWLRLPWLMCGLALPDEDKARSIARRVLESFERDPRFEFKLLLCCIAPEPFFPQGARRLGYILTNHLVHLVRNELLLDVAATL